MTTFSKLTFKSYFFRTIKALYVVIAAALLLLGTAQFHTVVRYPGKTAITPTKKVHGERNFTGFYVDLASASIGGGYEMKRYSKYI